MKLTTIFFNTENQEIVQKINFEQANQIINKTIIEKSMNQKMLLLRYSIFGIIISKHLLWLSC
ncbi:hypothetical protein HB792_06790 [Listeria welshimeri]|nr:hypothetical protein [Listeria welshimeri]